MIHTLDYISEDEFEADYRAEIYEQTNKLAEDYDWWQDPIWLYDKIAYPYRLTGGSQLIRLDPVDADGIPILGNGIPFQDNALMGYIDLQRIVALLQQISKQHEIIWTLSAPHFSGNQLLGKIENGRTDTQLEASLETIRQQNNITENQLFDEGLHRRIREKHTVETNERLPSYPDSEQLPPEQEVDWLKG